MDSNHTAGTIIGAIMATYKSFIAMLAPLGFISFELLVDTALLAFAGGAIGWCGAEFMKYLKPLTKQLISKIKNKFKK